MHEKAEQNLPYAAKDNGIVRSAHEIPVEMTRYVEGRVLTTVHRCLKASSVKRGHRTHCRQLTEIPRPELLSQGHDARGTGNSLQTTMSR